MVQEYMTLLTPLILSENTQRQRGPEVYLAGLIQPLSEALHYCLSHSIPDSLVLLPTYQILVYPCSIVTLDMMEKI